MKLLVNIDVDDLARGERFYCEALSLRVGRRFGTSGVELLGLEAPIYLLVKAAGSAPFGRHEANRAARPGLVATLAAHVPGRGPGRRPLPRRATP